MATAKKSSGRRKGGRSRTRSRASGGRSAAKSRSGTKRSAGRKAAGRKKTSMRLSIPVKRVKRVARGVVKQAAGLGGRAVNRVTGFVHDRF